MAFSIQWSLLCVILYLYLREAVSQVQLNISPSEVVLTTSSPVSTTFQCTVSSETIVTTIYNMQIISKGETGTNSVVLAEADIASQISPTLGEAAPEGSSVSGGIDTTTPTSISQVQMNISPFEVVLTTSSPSDTTFKCTISSPVTTIYNMQILSKGKTGTSPVIMAQIVKTIPTLTDDAPQGSSISGGIDTTTPTSSTLTLTRPTADILCSDKGYYECLLTYQTDSGLGGTAKNNQTLSIYALPSDLNLSARKNGQLIQGTATNEADVDVGDMVQFTCTANIGSNNSTKIRWKRTSEASGTVDNFLIYNPPQGSYDDGTPSSGTTDCTYSRTATMSYNVTSFDANRLNNLAFQCYISVVPPGQNTLETQNPPTFYIHPIAAINGFRTIQTATPTVTGNRETATIPTVSQTCSGYSLGLAVGITIGTLLFIEGVVGAVIYYIINRRKSLTNSSTAGPNLYEIPNRRAFETEHVYNQ